MSFVIKDTNIFIDLIKTDLLEIIEIWGTKVYTSDLIIEEFLDKQQRKKIDSYIERGYIKVLSISAEELGVLFQMKSESQRLSIQDCSVWYLAKKNGWT